MDVVMESCHGVQLLQDRSQSYCTLVAGVEQYFKAVLLFFNYFYTVDKMGILME